MVGNEELCVTDIIVDMILTSYYPAVVRQRLSRGSYEVTLSKSLLFNEVGAQNRGEQRRGDPS